MERAVGEQPAPRGAALLAHHLGNWVLGGVKVLCGHLWWATALGGGL